MAKRIFAALITVLVFGLQAADTRAQSTPIKVDGCAKLARVIYAEVSAAAIYGPGQAGPWLIDIGRGDIAVCTHAAKTVSQAFTSAMLSAGIPVTWGRNDRGPHAAGDFCWSGFLSQCYPGKYPEDGQSISSHSALVQRSWAVVSQIVMREMYNPFSSDEVRFRDDDLKLRLGLSLRSVRAPDARLGRRTRWH